MTGSWAGIDELVAVAQARNFSQAARRLGCSTSQVSREIAALEDRLGQRLFYRTTRHVSLTDAGQQFYDRCRRLVEERDEALTAMLDQGDQLQGQLRMTCSIAYGERFIAPIINRFLVKNPTLHCDVLLTNDVIDIVSAGVDLAVRFGTLKDSHLRATRLTSRTRRLCASPAYLQTAGAPERLESLSQFVCLRGTAEVWQFTRRGRPYRFRPAGRLRCNSGYAVLSAALSGLGLCQLPDFYVDDLLRSGELVELLAAHRPEDEGVWAVYPYATHVPTKVRAMLSHLQAEFSGQQALPH